MYRTGDSRGIIPVSVLATSDPVLRDSALFGLLMDGPGVVAVRHDIHEDHLRRVVLDATGVVEDVLVPLEHACLSCAVREDAVPTIARLAQDGRWTDVLLALPVSAEPLPAARALAAETAPGGKLVHTRVATSLAIVDADTLQQDLFGDDTLVDRGLELTADDERSVGEALAAQIEQADLVVASYSAVEPSSLVEPVETMSATTSGLLDRLRGAGTRRVDGLHALSAADLGAARHSTARAERRAHPLGAVVVTGSGGVPDDRSWTLELSSPLPFHPERLLERIEDLSTGGLRARGVFHVADRPGLACLWDGAGGQLAFADLGPWSEVCAGTVPHTRIVVVGVADDRGTGAGGLHDERQRLREAFQAALCTPEEMAAGVEWLWREDHLEPWLGARSA
ncbi:GTP-binding protein [Promicromonospora soli]|uniref:Cobalamin biosynthesis protein CobW n=1 Tax=Promicromonospora soli TaxID=2035533 RepID=A0A919G875_9MICO|nr:GTP-binding protein [Promicromonospora soli]GHH79231.1 cobalamin biosynthesis protein CobW [Promicromonospora soli]